MLVLVLGLGVAWSRSGVPAELSLRLEPVRPRLIYPPRPPVPASSLVLCSPRHLATSPFDPHPPHPLPLIVPPWVRVRASDTVSMLRNGRQGGDAGADGAAPPPFARCVDVPCYRTDWRQHSAPVIAWMIPLLGCNPSRNAQLPSESSGKRRGTRVPCMSA